MSADNGENGPIGDGPDAEAGQDLGSEAGSKTGSDDPVLEALMNEAMEHHRLGRFEQAAEGYWKVLEAFPEQPQATYFLGMVMHRIGENDKACELVSRALAGDYGGAQEYCNLGIIYNQLGRLDDVVICQKHSIALDDQYISAYFNLGNAYRDLGQPEASIEALQTAVTLKPDFPQAYNNLGLAMHDAGRFEDALGSYDKALNTKPDYADAYLNMGNALRELNRPDAAAVSFQKAIVVDHDSFEAHNNLGNVLMELDRFEGSAISYAKAISLKPDDPGAHKNFGIINLLLGNFEIGWAEYSWRRLEDDPVFKVRAYSQPFWDGEDLTGKTIFIYPEQGLGDTIQFVRYLPVLQALGGQVVFDAPLPLVRLLEDLDGVNVMVKSGDTIPPFDYHLPLLELPRLFDTTPDTIPAAEAYLSAEQSLEETWAERLGPKEGYRVGLVWAGNPSHLNDRNRSITPELFRSLAETPGVSAYSLLVGRDGEAGRVFGDTVTDLEEQLTDFAETAAAIANMDLVISVDTAVVHLAGALGAPVWTLLPFNPDWRWMLDRGDSPWYPTMRLFRQEKRRDWQGVLDRVAAELAERVGEAGNGGGGSG